MDMLRLALKSRLPLIHVTTDDTINVQEVIEYLANEPGSKDIKVAGVSIPDVIKKAADLQFPEADVLYTSDDNKTLSKLYRAAVDQDKTIVFVNAIKAPLMFDGGVLVPPKELVLQYLTEMGAESPQELLPAFGGLTLKDVGEVAKMTMTRDESLTVRGINDTRKGYRKLQGITQVDTQQDYYIKPPELEKWLGFNVKFFHGEHAKLRPRGLLFGGPPGTGKTEAAKAIASTFNVPLYRLDLGTMMGKYVGDSEGNLNAALQQIDEVEPCVVIFDEVEKVFRSMGGDSGVTSRMLSQLLWWLQAHQTKVFTVMTTNDMSVIPPELFREGRIDKTMTFNGIPDFQTGYTFAKGALVALLAELKEKEADVSAYEELSKRVKMAYADNTAVPQAKLVQLVNSLVKEFLTGALSVIAPITDDTPAKATVLKLGAKKA
jgi:hypothetical protein